MMNFFTEIRKEIKVNELKRNFEHKILKDYKENKKYLSRTLFSFFDSNFKQFNAENPQLKYYFLNLYQILKYIDEDIPNKNLSKKYTNFLRAQLSKDELILLAYNAIGVQSFTTDDYQILVEKYEFFEHLEINDFSSNISHIVNCVLLKYSNQVFGKNKNFQKLETYKNNCDKE